MELLLSYLKANPLPKTNARQNVSKDAVETITLGMVQPRGASSCRIGETTTYDKFNLLRLALGLLSDSSIVGSKPEMFTSICVNANFACELHVDKHNEGLSTIVAGGDYAGGEFHLLPGDSVEDDGGGGVDVDIHKKWFSFDGGRFHRALPFEGFRVSVVFFSVPLSKCDIDDLVALRSLGFKVPDAFGAPRWPYNIYICTAGRAPGIECDTLSVLFGNGDTSIPPHAATLCVKQSEVDVYKRLGFKMLVVHGASVGLPEQRAACTQHLPHGSFALFADDDVQNISKPAEMSLHELILYCFLETRKRNSLLFGLNVSQNERHLRDNISCQCGLVCGYFFGLITADCPTTTPISDSVGGAAEDIERSLRYHEHSGLCRFNFASAQARNGTNIGGLQDTYGTSSSRAAAHEYVVRRLTQEFPTLIQFDAAKPNKCVFLALKSEPRALEHVCTLCGKTYARKHDLLHHMAWSHPQEGAPPETIECPNCKKSFKTQKTMMAHLKNQRCYSKRGRKYANTPRAV